MFFLEKNNSHLKEIIFFTLKPVFFGKTQSNHFILSHKCIRC